VQRAFTDDSHTDVSVPFVPRLLLNLSYFTGEMLLHSSTPTPLWILHMN
jgi:hypothetical protein